MNSTAVIIARFQTPYLHEGHRSLLDHIKENHHKVVLLIGVTPVKGSKRNPFDFYTREKLLKQSYPDFVVLPLADHRSDEVWSANIDALLLQSFPNEEFVLYGGRDSFIPFYSGRLKVEEFPEKITQSATQIRNTNADKVLESEDFRMGINYAYHNAYNKVYPTVDIAVFKENRRLILLGRKEGRRQWQLPGGFVDVCDSNFEHAAKRELIEECGCIEVGPMQYVGSAKIDDWRYRFEEDKIMTLLFSTDLVFGHATASDDLKELSWFQVDALEKMLEDEIIAVEHRILIEMIQEKIFSKELNYSPKNLIYENA